MKDIAIYGAGGFGREVACLINSINSVNPQWNLIGFYDDGLEIASTNKYGKILGGIDDLNVLTDNLAIVIAIGSPDVLYNILSKITNDKIYFPNIISPDLLFLDESTLKLGIGNIICSKSIISCNVEINDFNIMNISVTVGHDTKIGSYNVIMPSVNISGTVSIGNRNFFGVSSVVLQQIKIGNGVRIGAGSVIMRQPMDNELYFGVPAIKIKY